jgi:hypothetical protein
MLLGLGVLAGADGLMVVSDGTPEGPFELTSMDAARVAGGLLGLCHPITPGLGRPVNIPADLLDQAAARAHGDLWAMADTSNTPASPASTPHPWRGCSAGSASAANSA